MRERVEYDAVLYHSSAIKRSRTVITAGAFNLHDNAGRLFVGAHTSSLSLIERDRESIEHDMGIELREINS